MPRHLLLLPVLTCIACHTLAAKPITCAPSTRTSRIVANYFPGTYNVLALAGTPLEDSKPIADSLVVQLQTPPHYENGCGIFDDPFPEVALAIKGKLQYILNLKATHPWNVWTYAQGSSVFDFGHRVGFDIPPQIHGSGSTKGTKSYVSYCEDFGPGSYSQDGSVVAAFWTSTGSPINPGDLPLLTSGGAKGKFKVTNIDYCGTDDAVVSHARGLDGSIRIAVRRQFEIQVPVPEPGAFHMIALGLGLLLLRGLLR